MKRIPVITPLISSIIALVDAVIVPALMISLVFSESLIRSVNLAGILIGLCILEHSRKKKVQVVINGKEAE